MIIDCQGHYTSVLARHKQFHEDQLARLADPARPEQVLPAIGDDEIQESVEPSQLGQSFH